MSAVRIRLRTLAADRVGRQVNPLSGGNQGGCRGGEGLRAQALLRSFLSTSATTFFRESKFSGAATSSSSTVMAKRS
jgi:hypothetical protein